MPTTYYNPKIGAHEFMGVKCPLVLGPVMELEDISRNGIDGNEVREIGKRGIPTRWVLLEDTDAADTLQAAYVALSGTIQSVRNVNGATVTNCKIRLEGIEFQPCIASVGGMKSGTATSVLVSTWTIQAIL